MLRNFVVCIIGLFVITACTLSQAGSQQPPPAIQTEVASAPTSTPILTGAAVPPNPTSALTITSSGRLIYVSGQTGDQTLWLRDLTQPEPNKIAGGAQVYGYGSDLGGGILYGVSTNTGGLFSVYFADIQGKNPILLGSGVEQANGIKSPDGSKMLIEAMSNGSERLELFDITSGLRQIVVETAEEVQCWFMNEGRTVGFIITQQGRQRLYLVDADLQQLPQELASGQWIYQLWLDNNDPLAWITHDEGQDSLHIYDPTDGSVRELLRGPSIRWAILGDSAVSLTLDRADGSEQYFMLTSDGLHEVSAQVREISPDQKHIVYEKEWMSYLGKPGAQDLRYLEAADLLAVWTRFTTDSKYVVYIAMTGDQSEFAVFTVPTSGGEARELARFTAPPGSSDPSRGVGTISYPAGYGLVTSRDTARGGFVVSPNGTSVLLYWSWLTGDQAGTHRLIRAQVDGTNKVILSEGNGILPSQPQFTPNEHTVFTIVQGNDGLQELRVFSTDGTTSPLISDATNISYHFTADRRSAILGVSANVGGNRIYLVDLATLNTSRIADGTYPQLIDPFSIDGNSPWK